MPTFPFIIQSNETLDQQSMKYVRSHVTRQSMKKRRELSDRDGQKQQPLVARPSTARARKQSAKSEAVKAEQQNDDSDEQHNEKLTALTTSRRRDIERLRPGRGVTGTIAEFCSVDLPRKQLFKLLSNYHEFNSLYHVYNNGRDPGFAPFSGYFKAVAHENPLWLTSCSLVAFSKIDTLREQTEVDILQYKAIALQHLLKAIKHAATNNDDITILSLIAYLSFEMLNAVTPEDHFAISAHFKGIASLVKMRSGEEEIAKTAVGEIVVVAIKLHHLMYALMENMSAPEQYVAPPKLRSEAVDFVDEPHYCFSPILRSPSCTDSEYDLRHPQAVLPFLMELNAGWELLFLEYHSSPDSIDYLTYSAYRTALQMPAEPIAHTTGRVQDDVIAAKLARSSYLAGLIFYRAIVSLTPFSDPVNEKDVTELHVLMKGLDPSVWNQTPYIHIWIVMVGVSASVNQIQKRFFGTQISRSGILFGCRWWNTFSQAVHNFAWLQKVLRGEVLPTAPLTLDDYPLSDEVAQSGSEDVEVTPSPTLLDMARPPWPQEELASLNLGNWPSPDVPVNEKTFS